MKRVFARLLLAATRWLLGVERLPMAARPAEGPAIYFARHTSHLDTLAILAALPEAVRRTVHPIAARDYWGATWLRRFVAVRCLNAVLIDRTGLPGEDAVAALTALLRTGRSVILFPEGTRGQGMSASCEPGDFKSGLFRLAERCPDAELVPVQLDNLHRALPKGSCLLVPLRCGIRFGKRLARLPGETKECFLARARAAVAWSRGESLAGAAAVTP